MRNFDSFVALSFLEIVSFTSANNIKNFNQDDRILSAEIVKAMGTLWLFSWPLIDMFSIQAYHCWKKTYFLSRQVQVS